MGLLGIVDSVLGSDFSGSKAKKNIDKASATANAANSQAIETLKQYGDKAVNSFINYTNQGMDVVSAAERAASEAQASGFQQGQQTYTDYLNRALGQAGGAQQDYTGTQERLGAQTRSDLLGMFDQANQARQPYEQAGMQLLGAVPSLAAALGISGQSYDVAASPLYSWQKEQLDRNLTHQLAAMGINNDAAAAMIRSQGIGQLGAEERERQVANLMQTAGMGLNVASTFGQPQMQQAQMLGSQGMNQQQMMLAAQQAAQAGDMATANMLMQAANDLANMQVNQGLNQANIINQSALARGGMLSGLGQNIGQTQLGIGGNVAQGQIAQGQNLMNAGIAKAQIPNGMNQLINTGLQLYGMGAFGGGSRLPAIGSTPTGAATPTPIPDYQLGFRNDYVYGLGR